MTTTSGAFRAAGRCALRITLASGVALASLLAVSVQAGAQDEVEAVSASDAAVEDGVQVFEPAFFDVFNPVTALDMVRQVPGFAINEGDNARGFGATAGNILVDGERPASKERPSNVLQRIPAENVERVELIRGGGSGADVRGRTTLVNVILREGQTDGPSSTYNLNINRTQGDRIGAFVQVTRNFRFAGADMNFNFLMPLEGNRSRTDELLIDANGDIVELRDEWFQQNYREPVLGLTAAWKPTPRDAINVNLRGSTWAFDGDEASTVTDAAGDPLRWDFSANQERETHFREIGADWEHQFGENLSIKLVGLDQDVGWTGGQLFQSFGADGSLNTFVIDNPGGRGERIGRGALTWKPNEAHTFEIGLESAFNFRDSNLSLTTDDGSGPVAVPIPVAVTRVEELRGEAFVTDLWTVTPKLSLEAGFNFEASRITQTGDAEQEREFTYPKPRVIATYAIDANDQFRFSVVRDVAQLDFFDFVSSVSLSDDTVNRGNENLEPEQTWKLRTEWERRFSERSVVTVAGFYDAVESVQDLIVIDADGDGRGDGDNDGIGDFSAPGNLGDGVRMGLSIEGSTSLDLIGLSNAVLRVNGTIQNSEVDDPITGETRAFSNENDYFYNLDFRQDLPRLQMAWGWDYQSLGARPNYRANELGVFNPGEGDLDVFLETTRWFGVTMGVGVDNVFSPVQTNERTFYDIDRAGPITGYELRDRTFGQQYFFRLSGSF